MKEYPFENQNSGLGDYLTTRTLIYFQNSDGIHWHVADLIGNSTGVSVWD